MVGAKGSQGNFLLIGEMATEGLRRSAFKFGEAIVRFLVLRKRKPGQLDEVIEVGADRMKFQTDR